MNSILGESPSLRADVVSVSLGQPMFAVTGQVRSAVVMEPEPTVIEPVVVALPPPVVTVHQPPPPKVFASGSKDGTPVSVTVESAPITVTVHPTPLTVIVPVETFTALLKEVMALRDDLKRRSFGGRWTRFVGWIQDVWSRLT